MNRITHWLSRCLGFLRRPDATPITSDLPPTPPLSSDSADPAPPGAPALSAEKIRNVAMICLAEETRRHRRLETSAITSELKAHSRRGVSIHLRITVCKNGNHSG